MKNRGHLSIRWVYGQDFSWEKKEAWISLEKAKHLKSVLRLEDDSPLHVTDGRGTVAAATVDFSLHSPKGLQLKLNELIRTPSKSSTHLKIIQGLPKNKTMDEVVEKLSELGAHSLLPVLTSRSVVIPEKTEKYLQRWNQISIAALEQSEQSQLLKLEKPLSWIEFLAQTSNEDGAKFVFASEERQTLSTLEALNLLKKAPSSHFHILFGPEGGFSQNELIELKSKGFQVLSLGSGILKVETAAVAGTLLAKLALEEKTSHNPDK